jgi:hypothetical protein
MGQQLKPRIKRKRRIRYIKRRTDASKLKKQQKTPAAK